MRRLLAIPIVFLASGTSVAAPAIALFPGSGVPPAELASDQWQTPTIVIYEAKRCVPEDAVGCALASFTCEYGLRVRFDGFDTRALSNWMAKENVLSLKMTGVTSDTKLVATEILNSDVDGRWSVVFVAAYSQNPRISLDADLSELEFATVIKSIKVSVTDSDRTALNEFVRLCRRATDGRS